MKRVGLILSYAMIALTSCDDTESLQNNFAVTIEGTGWEGTTEIYIDENDSLSFLGIGNENVFGFKLKLNGERTYEASELSAFYYTTVGMDVLTSSYQLDKNSDSKINLEHYDSEEHSIEGSLNISFVKKWSNPENDPERIDITSGTFEGTIIK